MKSIQGLFSRDHMEFEVDRVDDNIEPSLIDMTKKAIEMLKPNPNGFFLLVEGKLKSFQIETK